MDSAARGELKARALAGYSHGPDAAIEATTIALRRAESADSIILVEGISDQIALETAAGRLGVDLDERATVVIPIGGAHGAARYVRRFGPQGANLDLSGLFDRGEVSAVRDALRDAGIINPQAPTPMESLGFFVCVEDLEDELIRAHGVVSACEVLESQGDLGSFRTMQKQPAWRGKPEEHQLRRFLGAGAKRKLRYARLLVSSLEPARIPSPLRAVLGCP